MVFNLRPSQGEPCKPYLLDSIVHYCTNCLTREMPLHNLLPCCNLCLFYSPPQVHFVGAWLVSFWMTSHHDVFGQPGLLFPWDGFQWYSLLGIWSMFTCCKWPNHWRWSLLITAVSGGCHALISTNKHCFPQLQALKHSITTAPTWS